MFSKCQKLLFKVVNYSLKQTRGSYKLHALKMGGINSGVI